MSKLELLEQELAAVQTTQQRDRAVLQQQANLIEQKDALSRLNVRQQESAAVWLRMREYLDIDLVKKLLPKEAISHAIGYTNNHWAALQVYVSNAHVPMDNNLTEQLMKQVAIGRKNWLFIGSLAAGARTADLMTLVSSAIRNVLHVWPRMREPTSKECSTPCWPAQRTTIPSAPTSGPATIPITSAPTARMSVETAPTANNAPVKKEETPRAELNHRRMALVDRNTRWCCCTLTVLRRLQVVRADRKDRTHVWTSEVECQVEIRIETFCADGILIAAARCWLDWIPGNW